MSKFCVNCGAPLEEGDMFCTHCGQPVTVNRNGPGQEAQRPNNAAQNAWTQPPHEQAPWNQPKETWSSAQSNEPTMKWFKFIIWIQLYINAISNVSSGISILAYAKSDAINIVDIIYAVLCIFMAVAAIHVRFQLAGFKKKGPTLYLLFLAASIVISVLYLVVQNIVTDGFVLDSMTVSSLLVSVVLLLLNWIYFKKRQHLFIN